MRRFFGLLALIAIMFGLDRASADTVTQYLTFQTTQSLWGSNTNLSASKELIGTWDHYTFSPSLGFNIPDLGHFSAGVNGDIYAGKAGLIATAYAKGGAVMVNYPLTLTLNYPDPTTLKPGQAFVVSSSWKPGTPTATPSLNTKSPKFGAKIEGVIKAGVKIDLALRAFGEWFYPNLLDESLDYRWTLVDTKDIKPGTKTFLKGILSVDYCQPKIHLTNVHAPYTPDLFAIGNTANANKYSGIPGFFLLNGNISNAIGYVAGMATIGEPIEFSGGIDKTFLDTGFTGDYDFAALIASAGVGLQEQVLFKPNPQITLYLNDSNGTSTVTFPAGGSVSLTMPADGSGLRIDPLVRLDNTFFNQLTAFASADLTFRPFDVSFSVRAVGKTLFSFSDGAGVYRLANIPVGSGELYSNTIKLGFDPLFAQGISLAPPPPPQPTPLVANDDLYTAFQSGGVNGPVYKVLAGYPNTPGGVLANDSGPASFHAVVQHWQPDPNDPDTYMDIDQLGRVTFSASQTLVDSGIGQFSLPYQITDGQGHFATANVIVSLGGG